MFPDLFKGVDINIFHCDVCELSKHHQVFYAISNKLSSSLFSLVHYDVWWPSRVPNCSGAKWLISFIDDYIQIEAFVVNYVRV